MIFDVTSISIFHFCNLRSWLDTLELSHNDFHWFSDDIGQYVKSTSMGHTNYEVVGAILDSSINGNLEARNKGFTTFQAESLHSIKLLS